MESSKKCWPVIKSQDESGTYRGGPAFYIAQGLNSRFFAALFAVALIISFGLVFNAVQANSISSALSHAYGFEKLYVGIGIAVVTALVVFEGIRNIARVAEVIVPVMAILYLLLAIVILIMNITAVPEVLALIFKSAFGLQEAAGGITGGLWQRCLMV